ncbi:MAG: MgtC/SapB family protein [Alphaproteobacteria bacterium]|nr:MgtC/SapB family protein [Alphaproteobacteria bacterium]
MTWFEGIGIARTHIPEWEIALRVLMAALFAAAIGFERELKARAAGLRTHMLTALGAALFTVITFEIFYEVRTIEGGGNVDPIRIIEAVTAGVSFLAAGTIIHGRGQIQGLTTGAGIWIAGAIGVACGSGYYVIAFFGVLLALIIIVLLRWVERHALDTKPGPD